MVLLLLVCPVFASQRFGDLTFNVDPLPRCVSGSNQTTHGYREYRISITNHSAARDHQVELYWPDNTWNTNGNVIRRISRRVLVAADSTVRVSILQPPLPLAGQGMAATIDGRAIPSSLNITNQEHIARWGGSGTTSMVLLASAELGSDFWPTDPLSHPTPGDRCIYVSETPVGDWSRQWLGYSRYDAVAVSATEWTAMPEEVRSALLRYAEAGGVLVIDGPWLPPDHWEVGESLLTMRSYYRGFGTVYITNRPKPGKRLPKGLDDPIQTRAAQTAAIHGKIQDIESANRNFPVVENLGIPVRGLFVLMLLFAIAIGPVNLIFVSRRHRRIWLLWTVPLVSFLTCGIVVAYATFAEGWRGKARSEYLTILDETAQRASTIGWAGFYAPITPAAGLHFSYDTELTPHLGNNFYQGRARTLDWTTDQHLANGWIVARVPAHFLVRSSAALQRQRLTFTKANDALAVTNGLGTDIVELYVADDRGRIHHAANIPAGKQVTLTAAGRPAAKGASNGLHESVFTNSVWPDVIEREVLRLPDKYLRPNTYLAVLDTSPFIDDGLSGAQRKDRTVVYGLAKEVIHAD